MFIRYLLGIHHVQKMAIYYCTPLHLSNVNILQFQEDYQLGE